MQGTEGEGFVSRLKTIGGYVVYDECANITVEQWKYLADLSKKSFVGIHISSDGWTPRNSDKIDEQSRRLDLLKRLKKAERERDIAVGHILSCEPNWDKESPWHVVDVADSGHEMEYRKFKTGEEALAWIYNGSSD